MLTWKTAVGGATVFAAATSAHAVVLLNDNFDTYANQAAYEAAWTPTTAGQSTTLTSVQAFSTPNSVLAPAIAGYRNERGFGENAATATQKIEWSFRFFDTDPTSGNFRQYSEMVNGAGTGTADIVALGLNNTLAANAGANYYQARMVSVDGGTGSGAFFPLNGTGTPVRSTGWHELKAIVNLASVDFYVDTVLAKSVALPVAGQGKSYERIRIGSNLSSLGGVAYFDNEFVQTPEPASLAALGLAGLTLVRRRRA